MNSTRYEKLMVSLRYWLTGLAASDDRYYEVLRALEFFADLHGEETRKNGARGFYHQLSILSFVRNFHPMLPNQPALYIAILGHDGVEDYPELAGKIREAFPENYTHFRTLSKINPDGSKMSMETYVDGIERCPICVLAKAADRIHNLSTMGDKGAFSHVKQLSYIDETRTYYIPMLKNARRRFPQLEPICEAFKSVMMMHIYATERMLEAVKKTGTSLAPKAIEENRAAFESRFGHDLWAVADWLRENKLLSPQTGV